MYLGTQNEQCIGGPFVMADSYGSNPDQMYFWGYVYEGNLWITSHNSKNYTHTLSQVAYVIAEDMGKQTLYADGWIKNSESYGGMVILGFPIWLWYYIVFDYGEGIEGKAKLSFVFFP